jgi:hypothetical protein
MTSTPSILLLKRSGLSSDRPSGVVVQGGELAISRGATDPGLYFEDTGGAIRKIGPPHYGTTAPNSTPAGIPGNSVGELWTDSSSPNSYLNVWTGSTWVKIGAGYADSAAFATQANTALLASGAIFASGTFAQTSSTAILSSGSLLSSGTVIATGIPVAAIDAALPVSAQQGTLFYQTAAPSGLYIYTAAGWAQV